MNRCSKPVGGFTLVELLVSMALGFTILLTTTQLFIDHRLASQTQQQWLTLHEQGRHALQFLTTELRKAGYPAESFVGSALTAENSSGELNSDSIPLSYQNGLDCAGSSATSIRYYLQENTLRCDGNGSAYPSPQTLTSPIDGLQFRFGIDQDGDHSVDQYLNADQIADWESVRTVEVAILLRSESVARQQPDDTLYSLLDVDHGPYQDYYLRKIYQMTVQLRNR